MNKKAIRTIGCLVGGVMSLSVIAATAAGCGKRNKDSIVIMTDAVNGLFNPYYATAGADMDVVGLTQIGMLSTDVSEDGKTVTTVADDEHATVAKAYDIDYTSVPGKTVYKFVIKNGLKFSDGKPLTMNDVMFNIYENLDPVYTGSSTMYSIDIEGLSEYRTQTTQGTSASEQISSSAVSYAYSRIETLRELYMNEGEVSDNSYSLDKQAMYAAIDASYPDDGYKTAISEKGDISDEDARKQLKADYDFTLETFQKELESDYRAAQESYDTTIAPWAEHAEKLKSETFRFFLHEGKITPKYKDNMGRPDRTKIESFDNEAIATTYDTKDKAIERVFNDTIKYNLHDVLSVWGTAGTLTTQYTADATSIILRKSRKDDGSLLFPNISGIRSLGHRVLQADGTYLDKVSSVEIGGTTYKVACEHNSDGTPKNADEYDVLQITVNDKDPKAIYSFGFTVAPVHYYTADNDYPNGRTVDIENNQFGVEYADNTFQTKTVQSLQHVGVPVGAGPYMASDRNNSDNPTPAKFNEDKIVYYKANHNFMFPVKTEKICLQEISSTNALDKLQSGEADYVIPQFTKDNATRLEAMTKKGFVEMDAWQLGYGYIGINAGKVPDINIRKAIMSAMNTQLATEYYKEGTCETLDWPMSKQNWAYPWSDDGKTSKPNDHDYASWSDKKGENTRAINKVKTYMAKAKKGQGVKPGDPELKITFTIAGASITEHPTYEVFKNAVEILNDKCGWEVELKADSQALTKLSTGSLEVWAAAWGSTIDPDMYQVYHKNSLATSVYAWGYREIKADKTTYKTEWEIIDKKLSPAIDSGRKEMEQSARIPIYERALGYVLDLAVELPVYQRQNMYAYNGKTVKGFPETVNAYTSPLERIWELELIK